MVSGDLKFYEEISGHDCSVVSDTIVACPDCGEAAEMGAIDLRQRDSAVGRRNGGEVTPVL